ncbi:TPM domain-containing protein [Xylocopilactobacillus apicola]|uniref:TPM domain-containing protein n=1 Tax=Xylocopilactobacillus apicola TaxID=2932184 RepID=A0AAU9D6D5_9LACO|nr:TPM domain-containing protein [Xylocopilactobacillus apicola]BDR57926.1 hypothetical protein XA3_03670 [Xylocopilactobacillus apicola]
MRKKIKLNIVLFVAILFNAIAWPQIVKAATLPSSPRSFYYDEAGLLTDSTQQLIENKNRQYKNKSHAPQVVVAVVNSTGGEQVGTYARDLFQSWRIGDYSKNNGVLILYALNNGERNVVIQVGNGLDNQLNASKRSQILEDNRTNLKSTDSLLVNQGIQQTFNSITQVIDENPSTSSASPVVKGIVFQIVAPIIIFIIVASAVGIWLTVKRYHSMSKQEFIRDTRRRNLWSYSRYRNYGDDHFDDHFSGGGGGSGGSAGGSSDI